MIVQVQARADDSEVVLLHAENFKDFSVRLIGPGAAAALAATGTGRLINDSEAYVSVAAVRRLASREADETWNEGFASMLRYAQSHGWMTEDGSEVKAHIEPDSDR